VTTTSLAEPWPAGSVQTSDVAVLVVSGQATPPIVTCTVAPVPNESPEIVMGRLPTVGPELGTTLEMVGAL